MLYREYFFFACISEMKVFYTAIIWAHSRLRILTRTWETEAIKSQNRDVIGSCFKGPSTSFQEKCVSWIQLSWLNDTLNLSENSVFWPTSEHQISVMAGHIALKFSDHTLSPSNTQSVSRIFKSLHSHWDIAVQNIRLFSDFRITTKNSIKIFWDH